jgi:SAM-dependent methyltransferase
MNDSAREQYWRRTFAELHARPHDHLDYAAAEEQVFTFGACLVACSTVAGMACLDAGCGKGGFSRILAALGAGTVVGVDFIEPTIADLRRSHPDIRWESGNVCDREFLGQLGIFDRVFAIEVLQCVPAALAFETLWTAVGPNGRLIGVVPNGDNEFVQRRAHERPGLYDPLPTDALVGELRSLPALADYGLMGFSWRDDRSRVLYDLLPFTSTPIWHEPPKRVLFVARKSGVDRSSAFDGMEAGYSVANSPSG